MSILVLAALFYLVPLLCSVKFSLIDQSGGYGFSNYTAIVDSAALRRRAATCRWRSPRSPPCSSVLLVLPTAVLVRLKLPKLAIVMEVDHDPADRGAADRAGRGAAEMQATLAAVGRQRRSSTIR